MEKSETVSSPALQCNENIDSQDEEEEVKNESDEIGNGDDSDDDYIRTLLEREFPSCGLLLFQTRADDSIRVDREDAIVYILRRKDDLGFRPHTAYVAVSYFDRFLSRKRIDASRSWVVQLLSMACLSLAAKMVENLATPLSKLCTGAYNFASHFIQRMELMVLSEFEWRMGIMTPFHFSSFFVEKIFGKFPAMFTSDKITHVFLGAIHDLNIMHHRPSVIAAAATLLVFDQNLSRNALELKIGPLTASGFLRIEEVVSCYNLVQEMENERAKMDAGIHSPGLTPSQMHRVDAYGRTRTYVTSALSTKRKSLQFDDEERQQQD